MSKIYFQGTFGAYSHLAALSVDPNAEIIPCKTFDECFSKASLEPENKIIIPESNRITGNIGIEYLIFKHRLNIYMEHFQKIEHNLLGQPGSKLKDIKEVYSHAQGLSQCSQFIKENNLIEHIRADTAGSAETLEKFVDLNQTKNEIEQRLEQLRALDNSIKINVALAKSPPIGVDTEEDYMALKKIMEYKD